jgi:uridine kinase
MVDTRQPLFIGITGGTASGKTSLCNRIAEAFGQEITSVSLDSFYRGLS